MYNNIIKADNIAMMVLIPVMPKINSWQKIHNSIFPYTSCTSLVVWGSTNTLGSTLGLAKITKFIRYSTYIPSYLVGIFVGLLLSDSSLTIATHNSNPRIALKQSIINFPFLWGTYILLSHYASSLPYADWTILKATGRKYLALRFDTRAYPVLYQLHALFFIDGRKGITSELFHYLSPQALAFWIMGDGAYSSGGLILCTDCFSINEVVILINILTIRYGFKCTIHMAAGLPRIYISRDSMESLRKVVAPHMFPFSMYKLQGKRAFI